MPGLAIAVEEKQLDQKRRTHINIMASVQLNRQTKGVGQVCQEQTNAVQQANEPKG